MNLSSMPLSNQCLSTSESDELLTRLCVVDTDVTDLGCVVMVLLQLEEFISGAGKCFPVIESVDSLCPRGRVRFTNCLQS